MDLKIKDVAELLNVSETTIRRLLTDGKIPAYRINHQYRFNRNEIENWVMSRKLGGAKEPISPFTATSEKKPVQKGRGTKQFSLYRALFKGGTINQVQGSTKEEVIQASTEKLAKDLGLDPEVLSKLLLERESLMTTALGNGIALPHTRDCCLDRGDSNLVVIAHPKEPIPFGALDGKPVHTLFFLFARDDKWHLHLLAKIAHLCHLPETLEFIKKRPSKDEWLDYVKKWEGSIPAASEED